MDRSDCLRIVTFFSKSEFCSRSFSGSPEKWNETTRSPRETVALRLDPIAIRFEEATKLLTNIHIILSIKTRSYTHTMYYIVYTPLGSQAAADLQILRFLSSGGVSLKMILSHFKRKHERRRLRRTLPPVPLTLTLYARDFRGRRRRRRGREREILYKRERDQLYAGLPSSQKLRQNPKRAEGFSMRKVDFLCSRFTFYIYKFKKRVTSGATSFACSVQQQVAAVMFGCIHFVRNISSATLSPDESSPRKMSCMELFEVDDYPAQLELRNGPDHDVFFQFDHRSIPCHMRVLQKRSDFFQKLFRTFIGATHIDVVGINYELMNSLCNLLYFGYVTVEPEYSYELVKLLDLFQVKDRLEAKIFEKTLNPWETYEYEGKDYGVKEAIFVIKRVRGAANELHFVDSRNGLHSEPLILFPPEMAERKRMADRMKKHYIRLLQMRDAQRSKKKVRIGKRAPTKFVAPGQSAGFEKVDSTSSNVTNRSEGSSTTVLKKVKDEPVSSEKEDSSAWDPEIICFERDEDSYDRNIYNDDCWKDEANLYKMNR
ncbi:unnamed protein product [Trichogramma brassicae]|uniref:BTB domain-containing protein n=1 Tax=Trichogramma brassicae TaxID=86971 RepID=A0A6H5I6E9_9HYME|nr:unnamed protein product [Trichogramma brassicae]